MITHEIPQYLNSNNEKGIYTGLLALLGVVKKYEFQLDEDRVPLQNIQRDCFGILGNLINQLISNLENEIALRILHLICKIFYVSNQLQLATFLLEPGTIDPWIMFFKSLLDQPITGGLDTFSENIEEIATRDKSIQWKIKGIVAKLTYRLFSKFGNPKTSSDNHKEFSKRFQSTFAETLLESHLKILFDRHTKFVGSKCLNFVIKFISQATKIKCTMTRLKPFIENILY